MDSHIAYTSEQLDMSKVEEYYADLEINPKEFFNNMKRKILFQTKLAVSEFRKLNNKSDWRTYSQQVTEVNAYYRSTHNTIQLPAGRLQGFYFSDDRPMVMNYGATGAVVGHELTHGFDTKGKQFNWEGNMVDWWDPETEAKY